MATILTQITPRGSVRVLVAATITVLLATVVIAPAGSRAGRSAPVAAAPTGIQIAYVAHDGQRREATVLLPAGYRTGRRPAIPLVISPHGRGGNGRSNAAFWGTLPTAGGFAVVNPDGMGRRLGSYSYGYPGQIDDLARMPEIVADALPWVRIDPRRVYALGSSMGGQETLLLVARRPRLLAGAVAMDSVTDLALRYEQILDLPANPEFRARWGASPSTCLRSSMQREVGGTPTSAPQAYAARSPLSLARAIADSGVPLQIWWSTKDKIVLHQSTQSGALFRKLQSLGTRAPVEAIVGRWQHSKEMRSTELLPLALRKLGLLPGRDPVPAGIADYV